MSRHTVRKEPAIPRHTTTDAPGTTGGEAPVPSRPRRRRSRLTTLAAVAAAGVLSVALLAGCGDDEESSAAADTSTATSTTAAPGPEGTSPEQKQANVDKVLAFDEAGTPLEGKPRIAYLAECTQNPYCQARLQGMEDAAAKYGFEFKTFDANFNPNEQLKQVQDATTQGFDGYIFAPAANAPGCTMYNNLLKPTGKPVVVIDLPMCGDEDHTEGVSATVTMQRPGFFKEIVDSAFKQCQGKKLAAVGGFPGSDLYNFWKAGIDAASAKYPTVEVVSEQTADYDPRKALRVAQDALRANPDIGCYISAWDDMTRGTLEGIQKSDKTPGTDVEIYTLGATKDALDKIEKGLYKETWVTLPYEESYYGGVAMAMAITGDPVNGYIDERLLPKVTEGPGSIYVTAENADKLEPNY